MHWNLGYATRNQRQMTEGFHSVCPLTQQLKPDIGIQFLSTHPARRIKALIKALLIAACSRRSSFFMDLHQIKDVCIGRIVWIELRWHGQITITFIELTVL